MIVEQHCNKYIYNNYNIFFYLIYKINVNMLRNIYIIKFYIQVHLRIVSQSTKPTLFYVKTAPQFIMRSRSCQYYYSTEKGQQASVILLKFVHLITPFSIDCFIN